MISPLLVNVYLMSKKFIANHKKEPCYCLPRESHVSLEDKKRHEKCGHCYDIHKNVSWRQKTWRKKNCWVLAVSAASSLLSRGRVNFQEIFIIKRTFIYIGSCIKCLIHTCLGIFIAYSSGAKLTFVYLSLKCNRYFFNTSGLKQENKTTR